MSECLQSFSLEEPGVVPGAELLSLSGLCQCIPVWSSSLCSFCILAPEHQEFGGDHGLLFKALPPTSLLPLCSGVGERELQELDPGEPHGMDVQPDRCGLAGAASGFEDTEIPIPFPRVLGTGN